MGTLRHFEVKVQNTTTQRIADNIRVLSAAMVQKAKSGHPGGAMGAADFMAVLFSEFLRHDPQDTRWFARDRYFQDPGHMSPLLYSILHFQGFLSAEDLRNFRQLGSHTPGHPELELAFSIENTSGPLGMGHAMALGAAIAERFIVERMGSIWSHRTWSLISDGGIQEEVAYGVARLAGQLELSNLALYYDANEVQLSCHTRDVQVRSFGPMYESLGWRVYEVDGHDHQALRQVLTLAQSEQEKPVLVIGHSVMGKGAVDKDGKPYEGKVSTHGQPLDSAGASTEATIRALGGDPANPFVVWGDVAKAMAERAVELKTQRADWNRQYEAWTAEDPARAAELSGWLSGNPPTIDFRNLPVKAGVATRVSSGTVLGKLAETSRNVVCSSADLSNSDNTQAFLDKTGIFRPGDFKGAFLQVGVAELTMASVMNGIALHGGVVPICATFFVFSDFMKPAFRLAALMGLPVKYVFTHDSFRVGEDGPTHQPIEHEAQLRLLEMLTGSDGKAEMLVLRPADWAETFVAWKMALENTHSPTALILTRQNVDALPVMGGSDRYEAALGAEHGAYIVSDNASSSRELDLVFVANGSDVLLCHNAAEILRGKGKKVRVVSMISPRRFLDLPEVERLAIVPRYRPVYALSSGLPFVFEKVIGPLGRSYGLLRFGASAPAGVLEKQFGYVPESVAASAEEYLAEWERDREAICSELGNCKI